MSDSGRSFGGVDHAIDLAPHQQHGPRQIEPDHEDDDASQRAISFVVTCQILYVQTEPLADDYPATDGECTAR